MDSAAVAIDKLIYRNAKSALNQDEYARSFNALATRHAKLADQHEKLTSQIIDEQKQAQSLRILQDRSRQTRLAHLEFTPYLFHTLIDHAIAKTDGTIEFTFRYATEAAI
ncbi:hypothetical protein [Varibaculum massiliense]|uniref:hypothetical protein n=1 Tax=Varibaculum massiliense TaxID=1852372 RepID=UPI0008D961FD|nr:hypothetical protein [Varibaculum massiliense]